MYDICHKVVGMYIVFYYRGQFTDLDLCAVLGQRYGKPKRVIGQPGYVHSAMMRHTLVTNIEYRVRSTSSKVSTTKCQMQPHYIPLLVRIAVAFSS